MSDPARIANLLNLPMLEKAILDLRAEVERLTREREQLALAICGGEDAPGYANAQTVETLEAQARRAHSEHHADIDRMMRAETERDRLREALPPLEADAAAARKQVRALREQIDAACEAAENLYHNPEGTLWNFGTTPTALDRASWRGMKDAARDILCVLDPDRARAALKGEA